MLALLVFAVVWVGIRGFLAVGELQAAVPLAQAAQKQVVAGDAEAAQKSADELAGHAASAASLTGDPIWRGAEVLPGIGPNLQVMRVVSSSVDRIARDAVVPLASSAGSIDLAAFAPTNGAVDLQSMVDLQQPMHGARVAFDSADAALATVASAPVIGPLADARDELTALVADGGATVTALDNAVRLLPAMLGASGSRDTLLLFQNNAELRSLGGSPSALALVHADGGTVSMVQQADSGDFPKFSPTVVELPIETRALWGDNTASYIQDVNFTPQFPLAATIAREMWKRQFGTEVQSVVAVDPVTLSYLLRATGPITLTTGEVLSSENAVQFLLSDVYRNYAVGQQDSVFADAAAKTFAALTAGGLDSKALIEALAQAGTERRILIWNADPQEQAILADTTLAGGLPVSDEQTQNFGVYFNDMTGSKMDPYLDVQLGVGTVTCRNDGLPNYEIVVKLTNTAPADAATSLPTYVTGGGEYGTPPGSIRTSVHVYSAQGTYNLGVMLNGEPTGYHPTSDTGYTLSKVVSMLAPGESAEYRFGFLGGSAGEKDTRLESTPLVYTPETLGVALSCESALW
ncbi:DUF4012 domain-containing protein [Agromyces salentinus]|uniref:DUF4012 domain-containing protein n=1 Tax=Agromyces salentinus TaxID=269421 RepID=A0ABN2MV66_9MICO|nr:DUF4012 domain-containing protein [Agromyces salentinus]